MTYDFIITGAGFAGSVLAERIATQMDKKVLVLEKRSHIGGNCYDEVDASGVIVHTYGPHLFHTDNAKVYHYLSQFTQWQPYVHKVVASVDEKIIPIPFNFNTLHEVYETNKAKRLEAKLIENYGKEQKIPILELRKSTDSDLQELADYVYEKIFVNYTAKQWGRKPEEIDASVTARVPILTSYDNRYFTDRYQAVPREGYGKLFEKMLDHKNITVQLNCDALERLEVKDNKLFFDRKSCEATVIFTGMIDELFDDRYGRLPYRSIDLAFETINREYYQDYAVVNYPNEHRYTRITEFKHIHPANTGKTTILKEYPQRYERGENTPYYPMFTEENRQKYAQYARDAAKIPNLLPVGRLAEYTYYDMDDIVARALEIFDHQMGCVHQGIWS